MERHLLMDEHATYQVPTDRNEKAYDLSMCFHYYYPYDIDVKIIQ